MNQSQMRRIFQALSLVVIATAVSACGTAAYLQQQYSGYRVVDKQETTERYMAPTSLGVCVAPDGKILCQAQDPADNSCTNCRRPATFQYRNGPMTEISYIKKSLVLEAPDGKRDIFNATPAQYNLYNVGDIVGK